MNYNKIFRRYKLRHHKNYTTPEEAAEARTFVCSCAHDNMLLNREFSHNNDSFSVGLNDFSDQNLTEIRNILCPPIQPPSTQITLPILNITISFPDEQDYSSFLQPIVNQGACGSCWAFAPVAQLESLYLLNFIPFSYKFSPQYLVDCSRTPPNSGCNGGWPSVAMGLYSWISKNMPSTYFYFQTTLFPMESLSGRLIATPEFKTVAQFRIYYHSLCFQDLAAKPFSTSWTAMKPNSRQFWPVKARWLLSCTLQTRLCATNLGFSMITSARPAAAATTTQFF